MSEPKFRRPDLFQLLPLREYLRAALPPGDSGYVVEDLDLVLRVYGNEYKTDHKGKFMLIEQKHPGSDILTAQIKTFGLIDSLLRLGDPAGVRYLGYYVLNVAFGPDGQPIFPVAVNGHSLTESEFLDWAQFRTVLPSRFDPPTPRTP